jgi:transposase-like protein
VMDVEIKRWTARRKSALVLEIIQGKTTVAEASRAFDLTPAEIESWVEDGKRGMENALRAKPEHVREQYGRQLKDLQEAYGEGTLEPAFGSRRAVRSPEVIRATRGSANDLGSVPKVDSRRYACR